MVDMLGPGSVEGVIDPALDRVEASASEEMSLEMVLGMPPGEAWFIRGGDNPDMEEGFWHTHGQDEHNNEADQKADKKHDQEHEQELDKDGDKVADAENVPGPGLDGMV